MLRGSLSALGLLAGIACAQTRLPTVAVLPLSVTSSDSASASAYAEVLGDELLRGGRFRVLERSQIDKILREQGFQQSGACDGSECAVEVGRLLGIEQMVVGSVSPVGESRLFTLRRVDIATGEIKASLRRLHQGSPELAVTELLPQLAKEIGAETPLQGDSIRSSTVSKADASNPVTAEPKVRPAVKPEGKRTGWSLGASLQIQPKGIGIEESLRGGTLGAGWHFSNAPGVKIGFGADIALRHRVGAKNTLSGDLSAPSLTTLSLDPRLGVVFGPDRGPRLGAEAGIFLPLVETRYDVPESTTALGPFAKLSAGWEHKGVAVDIGMESAGSVVKDTYDMPFDQTAFFLAVGVSLP